LEVVDLRNNMETTIKKWKRIFEVIMANFHFHHHRNKPTYKDKWGSLYGDYKKIHDYQNVTCHNEEYWDMSTKDKVSHGLLTNFSKVFFELIDIFMNNRPCFNPPHSRDFMNPNDDVYRVVFFHDFSPCEKLGSNEEFNCEKTMERNDHPL